MIERRRWIVGVVLVLAVFAGQRFLQAGTTAEEIIAKLETKAAAVKTYSADVTVTMNLMGQKMVSRGKTIFKKPGKIWMETVTDMGAMKMKQVVVCDGKTAWTHQPMMNMVTKVDLEKVLGETGQEMAGQNTSDISEPFGNLQREGISYLRKEEIDGKPVYVFRGIPRKTKMQTPFVPANVEVWIDGEHGLVRKMIMFDQQGQEMIGQSYDNIKVNVEVPDTRFEFTVPEGAQVMDMTEGSIKMMKQMKGAAQEGD